MLKKENWTVTWKSAGITAGLFALTTVVCAFLQRLGLNEISQLRNETYVPLVYVLCVQWIIWDLFHAARAQEIILQETSRE